MDDSFWYYAGSAFVAGIVLVCLLWFLAKRAARAGRVRPKEGAKLGPRARARMVRIARFITQLPWPG